MSYLQSFVLAIPQDRKDDYREMTAGMWEMFKTHGALSSIEAWEDDVPEGEVTSFALAVKREPGEAIVTGFTLWPDKATYETAMQAMMSDTSMEGMEMPFDGKRMFWGGFDPIFEAKAD